MHVSYYQESREDSIINISSISSPSFQSWGTISDMNNLPKVAIIGRTNVGKSTLFNKLIDEQKALVSREAGTTRDRNIARCHWQETEFELIDTAGLDVNLKDELEQHIALQTQFAIKKADLVLYLVSIKDDISPFDRETIRTLQKEKKPLILVLNKVDNQRDRLLAPEFYTLGVEHTIPLSSATGSGTGDLLDTIEQSLSVLHSFTPSLDTDQTDMIKVSIIGRPNVGKSSILNSFLNQERAIVSDLPHTTRDSIDILLEHKDNTFRIVDTAGLRRKGKVAGFIEYQSAARAKSAIRKSDVVLFVLDSSVEISKQDQRIAAMIQKYYKGVVIVINKWDLIEKDERTIHEYITILKKKMSFLHWAPVVFISAKSGQRVKKILDLIVRSYHQQRKEIPPKDIDVFIKAAVAKRQPWIKTVEFQQQKKIRISSMIQSGILPPTFEIRSSQELHSSYVRFLENRFRETFDLEGTPVRIQNVVLKH